MGVPGLWDILRPAGKQRSLAQLAVHDGFERNPDGRRGLRVGIDASIWFFHATYGREGENPELRTLFFRCARLMSKPFLPLFVFDGPHRPELKRKKKVSGKDHWMVSGMQEIIEAFGFEWWLAPGEAEAELAYLNRIGVIDAIITDDVDTFLFGATTVIRNPGKMLSGNAAHPVRNTAGKDDGEHAYVYSSADIMKHPEISLSQDGLILIALLRGGDYDPEGLDRCGPGVAHALARSGFGETLLSAARDLPHSRLPVFLDGWRNEIRAELRSNARGFLNSKKVQLARSFPDSFPNIDVLRLYTHPVTSERKSQRPQFLWDREPDLMKLAALCERKFEWGVREIIIKRFRTVMWAPIVLRIMRRVVLDAETNGPSTPKKKKTMGNHVITPGTPSKMITRHFSSLSIAGEEDCERLIISIHGKREHASTDGLPEYRLEIAPAQLVRLTAAGVQGFRILPSQYRGDSDDQEDFDVYDDEDEDRPIKRKATGPKKPPPEPESHMRVWMPACMVKRVEPEMVAAYEDRVAQKERQKEEKAAKKAARAATGSSSKTKTSEKASSSGTKSKKAVTRRTGKEEEEEELSAGEDFSDVFNLPNRPKGKGKAVVTRSKPARKPLRHLYEEEEEEKKGSTRGYNLASNVTPLAESTNSSPAQRMKASTSPRLKASPPKTSTGTSRPCKVSAGLSRQKTILDLLDERYPSTRITSSSSSVNSPTKSDSQGVHNTALRPFPMSKTDDDELDWGREEIRDSQSAIQAPRNSTTEVTARRYSVNKSDSGRSILSSPRKSPRKSKEHSSPSRKSRSVTENARLLPLAMVSKDTVETITDSDEDVLIIDTDADDRPTSPSPIHRRSALGADSLSGYSLGSPVLAAGKTAKSGSVLSSASVAAGTSKLPIAQRISKAEIIEITSDSDSEQDKPSPLISRLVPTSSKRATSTRTKRVLPSQATRRIDSVLPVVKSRLGAVQKSARSKPDGRHQVPVSTSHDVIEIL